MQNVVLSDRNRHSLFDLKELQDEDFILFIQSKCRVAVGILINNLQCIEPKL